MKKLLIFLFLISSLTITCKEESRSYFCLDNGKCITLWKTHNNVCYVIPGKYRSPSRPSLESYITVSYTGDIDIIWQKNTSDIIVKLNDEKNQIIHQSRNGLKIVNYNLNKQHNDSVFLRYEKGYQRYKKDVDFMSIDIKAEYAYGKNGKLIR